MLRSWLEDDCTEGKYEWFVAVVDDRHDGTCHEGPNDTIGLKKGETCDTGWCVLQRILDTSALQPRTCFFTSFFSLPSLFYLRGS